MPQCYPFFPNYQIFAWTNSQLLNFAIFPKWPEKGPIWNLTIWNRPWPQYQTKCEFNILGGGVGKKWAHHMTCIISLLTFSRTTARFSVANLRFILDLKVTRSFAYLLIRVPLKFVWNNLNTFGSTEQTIINFDRL